MVFVVFFSQSTRADKSKISVEPFQTLLRELETSTVFLALRLLTMPIEGPAVDEPYKPKMALALTTQAEASPSTSTKKKKKKKSLD